MSRSPRTTQDRVSLAAYRTAWQATKQLLRAGRSFSGYERNCVFLNCRGPRFANISAITGLDFADDGRALGVTDWDHDGDLDVWLANRTGPRLRLMRNETISPEAGDAAGFVAIRLQGTVSNRDAIGARVEVVARTENTKPRSMIQTLYAGDAYLSQSSKWLHFGLGSHARVEEVIVRWPNGQTERFADIQPARRYRLVEGSGVAIAVAPRRPIPVLDPTRQPIRAPALARRAFFSNRLPLPILRYEPFEGSETQVIDTGQRPLLLVLWASWCTPCIAELETIREHADELRGAGLDVTALSLDGLDATHGTQPRDAHLLLEKLGFPFATGVATRETLDKLEFTGSIVLNGQPQLAVPISFLIDSEGALAAIYRGPFQVSLLLQDVSRLSTPLDERRDFAIPLPGRWSRPPRQLLLSAVARLFEHKGFEEDYARYLQLDADSIQRWRERATSAEQRQQWDAQYAAAHFNLGVALASAGESQEAVQHFQAALEAQPDHVEAHVNLGALLAKNHQLDAAIQSLRQAVDLEPDSAPARMNLAAALGSRGEFEAALGHYRHVLKVHPNTPRIHARLARASLEVGDLVEATRQLERAVRLNSNDFPTKLSLAWLRATSADESLRNGEQAVELGAQLNKMTGGQNPLVLDVLAAAYAEQGDFVRARDVCAKALAQVGSKQQALKSVMLARLKSYEAEHPHRDTDGKYP